MHRILENVIIQEVDTEKYHFYKDFSGNTIIVFKHKIEPGVTDEMNTHYRMGDGIGIITSFAKELENLSVNSILIAGLGLAAIPYYLKDRCDNIDIIEIDQDLIDIIRAQNYLPENVNIICGDVLTHEYDAGKKWDCIVIDIFWSTSECENQEKSYIQKYLTMLNPGGFLYIPTALNQKKFTN